MWQAGPQDSVPAVSSGRPIAFLVLAWLFLLRWHFSAFFSSLRKSDRDRLLAACYLLAGTTSQRPSFLFMHYFLDFLRCFPSITCHPFPPGSTGHCLRCAH